MERINRTINLGVIVLSFLIGVTVIYSFETFSKADNSMLYFSTKAKEISHSESKELATIAIFRRSPEFYKLNTILLSSTKVHFKKPLEQDLYFFFGPYIKGKTRRLKSKNLKFNKVLRDLFKFHFN